MTETFDFVIVGAGSAGCAMAYRLSEDGKNSVCVLEIRRQRPGPLSPDAVGTFLPDEHEAL